ncbi:MAG: hypothetical protein JXN59_06170 [Anaerolineae bacterium]|nr:hypothetical protein [Anaerolineae bacterium]
MNFRRRSRLFSLAALLIGVMLSGLLFFLNWAFGDRYNWRNWLMSLSYTVFIGSALIAFLIELGTRYKLPRWRVVGFFMVIGWVALTLISTTLDTITFLAENFARGISVVVTIGGLFALVIPGFLLMLFPWPPRFLLPKQQQNTHHNKSSAP